MDNNKETNEVILAVQKAALLMDPGFKIFAVGMALLITYLARMVKEGKLNKGEFRSVQEFIKVTNGKNFIENIPVNDREAFTQELEKLREMGVRYTLMPDLNRDDGFQQIMVYTEDKEMFGRWLGQYLTSKMQGGEHYLRDLKNLTEGKTNMISIPFEGDEQKVFQDFQELGINYAVLPDLNVGDGEIQLMVANSDIGKVEYWFKLYQSDQMKKGIEVPEMKTVSMEEYTRTGEMTEEQYVDTADEELKKANEKYEGKEPGEVEKSVMKQEKTIRSQNDAAYEKYHTDPNYIEISIDHETLVEKSHFQKKEAAIENGLFYSRVPKTWGRSELTLILPFEQVFSVNDGKTYIAFMEEGKKADIRMSNGEPAEESLTGKELYIRHYDKAMRTRSEKEQIKSQDYVQKNHKKNLNNFERRKYDFEDLESQLLRHDSPSEGQNPEVNLKKAAEKIPKNPVKAR